MRAIDHLDLVVTSLTTSPPARRRARADERAGWLRGRRATIESGPQEYDYSPGHYAVFFYGRAGIKLELVHRPSKSDLAAHLRRLQARLERLERERGQAWMS